MNYNMKTEFNKYYIYTCLDKDGYLDSHYYLIKLKNPNKRYTYVGSAELSQDYFNAKKGDKHQYLT